MKTETQIAERLIEERERYDEHRDRFNRVLEEHKASCQRFLEFLEEVDKDIGDLKKRIKKETSITFGSYIFVKRKISDLKQAIKLYDDAGI